ncbi:MAG: rhodanese-like domain-containing protein [Cocleimonas sp.]|nr:rhodanese-like domain-containing protein [Cocleimonas sp.]
MSKTFNDLIADALTEIDELFPWDLEKHLENHPETLLLDIREPDEFEGAHLKNSIHVPRGILEQACEWDYAETVPELVNARERPVLVICRSGNRSVLAALTMKLLGYKNLTSLKMGVKGCNDSDIVLYNQAGEEADPDWVDEFFNPPLRNNQLSANQ